MRSIFFLIATIISFSGMGQVGDMTTSLYDSYSKYKEPSLDKRRIKHKDIQPLIFKLKSNPAYTVQKVGKSIKGKNISLISIGTGDINVFLWSQMHGDEPTATQAIFDIFNFLNSDDFKAEKKELLSKLTLHFMPMLNPDGAEVFSRRNALGIDINRDALMLQSPEGQTLKRIRDSLDADFGFNLHDQSTYYNAERTSKPATISYLAPAYNYEKDINDVRGNAMKVIVFMNRIIQKYAPGQVGLYNDDFEPRAFGDNIQKWGTSAILIESGGFKNDVEKQEIRKLNFVSILSACYTIANGDYKNIPIEDYEKIPQNDRKLFDLKIERFTHNLLGKDYILDIGINHLEVEDENHETFYNVGRIVEKGDLSTFYGYDTVDATGYRLIEGKVYPEIIETRKDLEAMDIYGLLKSGYTYVRLAEFSATDKDVSVPINILGKDQKVPGFYVNIGNTPNFILQKDGSVDYAVVNGFLINLNTKETNFKNAIYYGK
ncbi:M14 family zinc carboxypeptidase [Gelidibacter maritimus]|uniref:Peptidase M14 n=1 Tax=Gelidibacter maritimus TaxID=2761487 RepID=A0A7W2M3L5_9FLAO|nr:M14 family zinc carboxypeptidase [Gelidibacter maritimus]MBA6151866.1 peptidase M14 [Gelidibacter maritimus]